jgi:hypothetical protein
VRFAPLWVSKYSASSGDPKNCRCIGRGEWFMASFKRVVRALSHLFFVCACCSVVRTILPRTVERRWERRVAQVQVQSRRSNVNAVPFQVTVTMGGGAILVPRGLLGPGGRWWYSAEFCFAIFDPRRALRSMFAARQAGAQPACGRQACYVPSREFAGISGRR